MNNLGIKFKKSDIRKALNHSSNPFSSSSGRHPGYDYSKVGKTDILVGLLFFKPTGGTPTKELAIDLLFYRKKSGGSFYSTRLTGGGGGLATGYLAGPNTTNLLEDFTGTITATMDYQFWTPDIQFVLFTTFMMEAILPGATDVIISGAQIDYGVGTTNYVDPVTKKFRYGTLKAESNRSGRSNPDVHVPNTILGLPCPIEWGGNLTKSFIGTIGQVIGFKKYRDIKKGQRAFQLFVKNFNRNIEYQSVQKGKK